MILYKLQPGGIIEDPNRASKLLRAAKPVIRKITADDILRNAVHTADSVIRSKTDIDPGFTKQVPDLGNRRYTDPGFIINVPDSVKNIDPGFSKNVPTRDIDSAIYKFLNSVKKQNYERGQSVF